MEGHGLLHIRHILYDVSEFHWLLRSSVADEGGARMHRPSTAVQRFFPAAGRRACQPISSGSSVFASPRTNWVLKLSQVASGLCHALQVWKHGRLPATVQLIAERPNLVRVKLAPATVHQPHRGGSIAIV